MAADDRPAPLAPEDAARLTEFARACKAAARAVILYPGAHPAIGATIGRIVSITSTEQLRAPLRIGVLADALTIDGRAPVRPDAAIGELAVLLHDHLIGELTVHPGGDAEAWRAFLLLLGRSPEDVRSQGGIGQAWAGMAGRHVELREIDYAEVLRERRGGTTGDWQQLIARCLHGETTLDLSDDTWRELIDSARDPSTLAAAIGSLDSQGSESGLTVGQRTAAVVRLLEGIAKSTSQREPEHLDTIMRSVAAAVGRLPPDTLLALLESARSKAESPSSAFVASVLDRMTESSIASFVARNAPSQGTPIERVAQAFQTLVPDAGRRERVLEMAHQEAAASEMGRTEGFEHDWDAMAQKLLTSYSDEEFVSGQYARELTGARTLAVDVEQTNDDPEERLDDWRATVTPNEVRRLDMLLLLDVLRIESDATKWISMMKPVVRLIEDFLLVGDFDEAAQLAAALITARDSDPISDRRQAARDAIDALVRGAMMQHIVSHLSTIDDTQFDRVKAMCLSLGEGLLRPLADALAAD
jgi:hypothetical protein